MRVLPIKQMILKIFAGTVALVFISLIVTAVIPVVVASYRVMRGEDLDDIF